MIIIDGDCRAVVLSLSLMCIRSFVVMVVLCLAARRSSEAAPAARVLLGLVASVPLAGPGPLVLVVSRCFAHFLTVALICSVILICIMMMFCFFLTVALICIVIVVGLIVVRFIVVSFSPGGAIAVWGLAVGLLRLGRVAAVPGAGGPLACLSCSWCTRAGFPSWDAACVRGLPLLRVHSLLGLCFMYVFGLPVQARGGHAGALLALRRPLSCAVVHVLVFAPRSILGPS